MECRLRYRIAKWCLKKRNAESTIQLENATPSPPIEVQKCNAESTINAVLLILVSAVITEHITNRNWAIGVRLTVFLAKPIPKVHTGELFGRTSCGVG